MAADTRHFNLVNAQEVLCVTNGLHVHGEIDDTDNFGYNLNQDYKDHYKDYWDVVKASRAKSKISTLKVGAACWGGGRSVDGRVRDASARWALSDRDSATGGGGGGADTVFMDVGQLRRFARRVA